jgi:hypothetical protein
MNSNKKVVISLLLFLVLIAGWAVYSLTQANSSNSLSLENEKKVAALKAIESAPTPAQPKVAKNLTDKERLVKIAQQLFPGDDWAILENGTILAGSLSQDALTLNELLAKWEGLRQLESVKEFSPELSKSHELKGGLGWVILCEMPQVYTFILPHEMSPSSEPAKVAALGVEKRNKDLKAHHLIAKMENGQLNLSPANSAPEAPAAPSSEAPAEMPAAPSSEAPAEMPAAPSSEAPAAP